MNETHHIDWSAMRQLTGILVGTALALMSHHAFATGTACTTTAGIMAGSAAAYTNCVPAKLYNNTSSWYYPTMTYGRIGAGMINFTTEGWNGTENTFYNPHAPTPSPYAATFSTAGNIYIQDMGSNYSGDCTEVSATPDNDNSGTGITGVLGNYYCGVMNTADFKTLILRAQLNTGGTFSNASSYYVPTPIQAGAVTYTVGAGSVTGSTQITATPLNSTVSWVVKVSSASIPPPIEGSAKPSGAGVIDPYTSGADITGVDEVTNKYVGIYSITSSGTVDAFSLITLISSQIKFNAAPTAAVNTIAGTAKVGQVLTGSYTYSDTDDDLEDKTSSGTSFRWLRGSTNAAGSASAITGANGTTTGNNQTYTTTTADLGKYIFYCVTPKASAGTVSGSESCSAAAGPIGSGTMSNVSVASSSTLASASNVTYTLNYTAPNDIPAFSLLLDAKLPNGVNLPTIADNTGTHCSQYVSVSIDNSVQTISSFVFTCLTYTVNGNNGLQIINNNMVPAGSAVSITITGATNPSSPGALAFTRFRTADGQGNTFDTPATLPSITYTSVTAPGSPTSVAATGGNVQATVNWSAPGSNGGAAISGYHVQMATSTNGTYTDAAGGCAPSTTEASTNLSCTATGLTNGSTYYFKVAAKNSAGLGDYSSASSGATPTAPYIPPAPPAPVNPFNPGGSSTVNTLTTTIPTATGGTYTPATSSLITNLSQVSNQAGVSDNGVVVILTSPNVPVQISSTAPNNILFSLPTSQTVPLQIGGQQISVVTNSQPIINTSTGQTTPSILATQTFTNGAGVTTQTLQVVSGQATTTSTSANQIVGGLTLSQGATLNNVVATAGVSGSSIGFYKNPTDLSGSISAEQGDVTINLSLLSGSLSTTDKTNSFSVSPPTVRTFALKAGEVARFDSKANLIGIFVGSLSGAAGKTGDALAVTPPAGVLNFPKAIAKLDGNVLGRLGKNLLPAFLDAVRPSSSGGSSSPTSSFSLTQDANSGVVKLTYDGRDYYCLPIMPVAVDTTGSVTDGVATQPDGTVVWTEKGVSVRLAPTVADLPNFTKTAQAYGFSTQVGDDGTLKLTTAGTVLYARPRFANDTLGGTAGFAADPTTSRATFTGADGKTQILDPTVYDASQINNLVQAVDAGWSMNRNTDGLMVVTGPTGQIFKLLPDYAVSLDASANHSSPTLPTAWVDSNGKLFIRYSTGFIPMTQGFNVQ